MEQRIYADASRMAERSNLADQIQNQKQQQFMGKLAGDFIWHIVITNRGHRLGAGWYFWIYNYCRWNKHNNV